VTTPETQEPEAPRGLLATLVDVFLDPRAAFTSLVRHPRFWGALALAVAVSLAFTGIWLRRVDPEVFFRTQLEQSGHWDRMPAESRAQVLESQARALPTWGWAGAALGTPVFALLVTGALTFVYRFFYASEVSFRQGFAVTTHVFLALGLVSSLSLLVMQLKDDWNIDPRTALRANPTLLLERGETARPLWALLESVDLVNLWVVVLLALGFGVASRRPLGSALWGVAVPWAVLIGLKVALTAAF
jgi:hypothetical protein